MNKYFALFLLICVPAFAHAQKVRLLNSTEQRWSGGIAGHSGVNYVFTVEFSAYIAEPMPDTLWVGNQPILITTVNSNEYANTKVSRTSRAVKYEIGARISHDEYADRYPVLDGKPKDTTHAPIAYKGVALLSYKVSGKPHYFVINKIMHEYPVANYP